MIRPFPVRARLSLLLLVVLCPALPAAGADEFWIDRLSISFDDEYFMPCAYSGAPFVPLTMYLVLTEPSFAELHGWEAAIRRHDGSAPVVMSASLGLGGQNDALAPEFRVSYPSPVPTTAWMVLATVQVLPFSWAECLVLTGLRSPAMPDERPLVWPAAGTPMVVTRHALWPNGATAGTGGCAAIPESEDWCASVVADEAVSWGAVKARYR